MEYIAEHGHFADLPFEKILDDCIKMYPHFFGIVDSAFSGDATSVAGDFHKEAAEENRQ